MAALLVGVMVYGGMTIVRSNATLITLTGQWLYPSLMLGAAGVVAARACVRRDERGSGG